jgi:hypothetical protein
LCPAVEGVQLIALVASATRESFERPARAFHPESIPVMVGSNNGQEA